MPNVFKPARKKNVGNTWTTIYETGVGVTSYLTHFSIACLTSSGVQVEVRVFDVVENDDIVIGTNLPVAAGSALKVLDDDKLVLAPEERIQVRCMTPGEAVDVAISLIEDINQ